MAKGVWAIFDFDGTMRRGDSIVDYLRFVHGRGLASAGELLKAALCGLALKLRLVSAERAKSSALAFMRRCAPEQLEKAGRAFVREKLVPEIYPEALSALRRHKEQGDGVLIESASPDCYMRYLLDALPLDAVLATETGPDGHILINLRGDEKPRRLKAWMREKGQAPDWARCAAYGDSASDYPVLALCGQQVMVNPKRGLKRRGRGWREARWGQPLPPQSSAVGK